MGGSVVASKTSSGLQEQSPMAVVVLPGKGLTHILPRFEALHELDHLEVRNIDLRVLREVIVLLRVQHPLYQQRNQVKNATSQIGFDPNKTAWRGWEREQRTLEEVFADFMAVLIRDDLREMNREESGEDGTWIEASKTDIGEE
ncbi:unnamed protein product, partial [Musa acuminata var. zebrina]